MKKIFAEVSADEVVGMIAWDTVAREFVAHVMPTAKCWTSYQPHFLNALLLSRPSRRLHAPGPDKTTRKAAAAVEMHQTLLQQIQELDLPMKRADGHHWHAEPRREQSIDVTAHTW